MKLIPAYKIRTLSAALFPLALIACGGGGGGGSSSNNAPSNAEIIANPSRYTEEQLKAAYDSAVETRFSGSEEHIAVDLGLGRDISTLMPWETDFGVYFPEPFYFGEVELSYDNETTPCYYGGSQTLSGSSSSTEGGFFEYEFENCITDLRINGENIPRVSINGSAAVRIDLSANSNVRSVTYYDELQISFENTRFSVTGYQSVNEVTDEFGNYAADPITSYLAIENLTTNVTTIQNIDWNIDNSRDHLIEASGEMIIANQAQINFEAEVGFQGARYIYESENRLTLENAPGYFSFGSSTQLISATLDDDLDGEVDRGAYIDRDSWLSGDLSLIEPVDINLLSLPPEVSRPYVANSRPFTTDEIRVNPGAINDPDTPAEQLNISYRWYLNGSLLENQTSNTLPAGTAVFGDTVQVSMVVSDSSSTIESSSSFITLRDSPSEIVVSGAPSSVTSEQQITFSAIINDPDIRPDEPAAAIMLQSPSGAEISTDGTVSWNAISSNQLVDQTSHDFIFGTTINDFSPVTVSITVNNPSAAPPIARSGIEVPRINYSMWIGDFDGDSNNEILSTDSSSRVMLIKEQSGDYIQSWMYPYQMPTYGDIKQVLPINIDQDSAQEILVVTDQGMSVINGLNNSAETLFETEDYIRFSAIGDIDNDDIEEIIYLSSTSQHSSNELTLNVIKVTQPEQALLSVDVGSQANEIVLANVDNDSAKEIILNNGQVYDGVSLVNEWFRGSNFGDSMVTAVDFHGDGISEIVGGDYWGSVQVFSAISRSELASIESRNNSGLGFGDLDNNGTQELFIGQQQSGRVAAYTLTETSELSELSFLDTLASGNKSITTGDVDNDGNIEVLWGSGLNSFDSGRLLVADVGTDDQMTQAFLTPVQLTGGFISAGWGQISPGATTQAIFYAAQTSEYRSQIAYMERNGSLTFSTDLERPEYYANSAAIADVGNDGFADIFLPITDSFNDGISVIQLSDLSTQWSIEGDFSDQLRDIRAFDLNNDSSEELIYVNNRTINAVDSSREILLGSVSFEQSIVDYTLFESQNEIRLAVCTGDRVHILTYQDGSFESNHSVAQECNGVASANIDTDTPVELLCITGRYNHTLNYGDIVVFDTDSDQLTESFQIDLEEEIFDVIAKTNSNGEQSLIVVLESRDPVFSFNDVYQIGEISNNGSLLWKSSRLIGEPRKNALRYGDTDQTEGQLLFSTSKAMYWFNP